MCCFRSTKFQKIISFRLGDSGYIAVGSTVAFLLAKVSDISDDAVIANQFRYRLPMLNKSLGLPSNNNMRPSKTNAKRAGKKHKSK